MSKHWGPTGVTDVKPVEIDAAVRQQIRLEVQSKGFESDVPDAFFDALGEAISHFNSMRETVESSKPAKVRNNLQAAIDKALELNDKLNGLDGNSRQLLGQVEGGEIAVLQSDYLWKIITALNEASNLANKYPMKGRLPEYERLWLAVEVAKAIAEHLGVRPTTTKESVFESVLTIVLEIATGGKVNSVHELARRALKAIENNEPEIAEPVPAKDE